MKHISKLLSAVAQPDSFEAQYQGDDWKARSRAYLSANGYWCRSCRRSDVQITTHHLFYKRDGSKLHEYADDELTAFCWPCHQEWHKVHNGLKCALAACSIQEIRTIAGAIAAGIKIYGPRKLSRAVAGMVSDPQRTTACSILWGREEPQPPLNNALDRITHGAPQTQEAP